ncbi:putative ATP binding protein, partial [Toxoplasma gondii GAB2-2007-GAL-DOM2]
EALLTDESYLASLSRSSALMLVEFYRVIQTVGVSSITGEGMADVVMQLERCAEEYRTDFLPFLEQQKRTKEQRARESAEAQLERFKRDYDPSVQAAALAAAVARGSTAGKSVSGGQETVSGGQETVSGGQETVSGGQETVSGGQETVTSSPKRQDDLAEVGASEA